MVADIHTVTVWLPDSPIVIAGFAFVSMLILVRTIGWLWKQFPFV